MTSMGPPCILNAETNTVPTQAYKIQPKEYYRGCATAMEGEKLSPTWTPIVNYQQFSEYTVWAENDLMKIMSKLNEYKLDAHKSYNYTMY